MMITGIFPSYLMPGTGSCPLRWICHSPIIWLCQIHMFSHSQGESILSLNKFFPSVIYVSAFIHSFLCHSFLQLIPLPLAHISFQYAISQVSNCFLAIYFINNVSHLSISERWLLYALWNSFLPCRTETRLRPAIRARDNFLNRSLQQNCFSSACLGHLIAHSSDNHYKSVQAYSAN